MKKIQPLTYIHIKRLNNRIRHARVETVVNQNEITATVGKGVSFSAQRVSSTATRGTIFEEV